MSEKTLLQKIADNSIVAAIYFVLCIVSAPLCYGQIQVRIAEAMVLLCFFRRDFIVGLTVGCLLANLNSTLGAWDIVMGTAATLISCFLIAYASPKLLIAVIWPVVTNALVVGFELWWLLKLPFWMNVLWVGIGETIAVMLGYLFFMLSMKSKIVIKAIRPERHLDFKW